LFKEKSREPQQKCFVLGFLCVNDRKDVGRVSHQVMGCIFDLINVHNPRTLKKKV
jgi:hypothetical protein